MPDYNNSRSSPNGEAAKWDFIQKGAAVLGFTILVALGVGAIGPRVVAESDRIRMEAQRLDQKEEQQVRRTVIATSIYEQQEQLRLENERALLAQERIHQKEVNQQELAQRVQGFQTIELLKAVYFTVLTRTSSDALWTLAAVFAAAIGIITGVFTHKLILQAKMLQAQIDFHADFLRTQNKNREVYRLLEESNRELESLRAQVISIHALDLFKRVSEMEIWLAQYQSRQNGHERQLILLPKRPAHGSGHDQNSVA